MNRGARLKKQRSTRVRLKTDAWVLLDRLQDAGISDDLFDQIEEMKVRLKPKPGVAARIELTGYTK